MNISEYLKILIRHYQIKEYGKVIEICEKILKVNKNIAEIYNFYGLALKKKKKK